MINNLFNYATSELSQDAFICWLMSFATRESRKEPGLRACAVDFLRKAVPELNCGDVTVSKIERQVGNHALNKYGFERPHRLGHGATMAIGYAWAEPPIDISFSALKDKLIEILDKFDETCDYLQTKAEGQRKKDVH